MLYTLTLYSVVCHLYLDKTEKKIQKCMLLAHSKFAVRVNYYLPSMFSRLYIYLSNLLNMWIFNLKYLFYFSPFLCLLMIEAKWLNTEGLQCVVEELDLTGPG